MTASKNSAKAPELILVTGAPRTGTTPIGHILALAPGASTLYEPMGPTGDARFHERFPIPGELRLSLEEFNTFLHDLVALNLRLKPQYRPTYATLPIHKRWMRSVLGSRSRISLLGAKLSVSRKTIIWKDPHASLAATQVALAGIPVVVCLRSPWAHAASFKRLGWISPIREIYARYRSRHAPVEVIDRELARIGSRDLSAIESATLLWHLVYTAIVPLVLDGHATDGAAHGRNNALLVSASALARDELRIYETLFKRLGLTFEGRPRDALTRRIRTASGRGGRKDVVHDWGRTVKATNESWKSILDREEEGRARKLNQSLYDALESVALASGDSDVPDHSSTHAAT